MTGFLTHGRIMGGTVATPDVSAALADYRDRLGLALVEDGPVGPALAGNWGCPALADARMAVLQPVSGAPCFIRLVEQPVPAGFVPTTTYGWAAYEITVQDVFGWPERLAGSGFDIIGPPREIPGLPYFVAMQMLGQGREMIYLNEVREDTPVSDLPRAGSPVDHIFIVILATQDRAGTMTWYQRHLRLEEASQYTIPYTMISRAFGLPMETLHSLSMAQVGRLPIIEIDDYPPQAGPRPRDAGHLPPGNAMVTLAVDRLEATGLDFITPPSVPNSPFYAGRRAATAIGHAGELIELVEIP